MTEKQKETLRFYTTNDYLLINGLLWNEDRDILVEKIKIINEDGRGVMKEALEQGFDKRWECSLEEGKRIHEMFEKRFPVIDSDAIIEQIIDRAKEDIKILSSCLKPLDEDLVLYRNINVKYIRDYKDGDVIDYLGFSSCSLNSHEAENAMYGSSGCTTIIVKVPKGTLAIRLDQLADIANEPDEVLLPPLKFKVKKNADGAMNLVVINVK